MTSSYLVTGATGNQGGSVARELLGAGQRVHALVRDPAKPQAKELESLGATLFVGDYDDADAINQAAAGVKGVFILPMPSPDPEGEAKQVQRCIDAALAAETVESLVLSSAVHADKHAQWLAETPDYPMKQYYHAKSSAEEAVRMSGIKNWTIFRAPFLDQNFILPHSAYQYPKLHSERKLTTALRRDLPLAQLDAHDVGRWAAAAFLNPTKFAGKAFTLAAENITMEQIAGKLGKVAGRDITTEFLEPAELLKDTTNPLAPRLAGIASWFNKVGCEISDAELAELKSYGIRLTSFDEFLEKNKGAAFAP